MGVVVNNASTLIRFINHIDDEVVFYGNKALDRLLLSYLLAKVDLQTGVVDPRWLSYSRIALDLSEKSSQGSRKALIVYAAKDIENCVARWVKRNVLVRSPSSKSLMLSFADWMGYLDE